ncbi:hypothetical protein EV644_101991 [Kribbella orskensis]|uniref:Uncharacterized protein n=1 Tax=Kribbella orskensis TaxID=2512216 RepID=A0ABY2BVT5_9ACTN|nr:hypothetical protein EV642_10149 [Kribbella sp. VKM Ac-2500]TCO32347.1 hypothetical protein EV644_101991 [Kribbella orskensis]
MPYWMEFSPRRGGNPCLPERDTQLARDRRQEPDRYELTGDDDGRAEREGQDPSQVRNVGCRPTEPLETVAVVVT